MKYDLVDLRLLSAIADCGTLTGGAARVGLAPSSASVRLGRVETALDISVFKRHARGLIPTPAGETLLRHARQVLARMAQMATDLAPYSSRPGNRVVILADSYATNYFLPRDIESFMGCFPDFPIHLEERPSPEIVRAIDAGEADIGVVVEDPLEKDGVSTIPYQSDQLVLIVPSLHRLSELTEIEFSDVLGEPLVCLPVGSTLHSLIAAKAASLGLSVDLTVQVGSIAAICRFVSAGIGIGIVPFAAAKIELASAPTSFGMVLLKGQEAQWDLQLRQQSGSLPNPAIEALLDHLKRYSGCRSTLFEESRR